MASKRPKADAKAQEEWPGRRIDLATFAADIERRRVAAGNPPVPRNAATRRTPSKRALLKAIEEAGGEW